MIWAATVELAATLTTGTCFNGNGIFVDVVADVSSGGGSAIVCRSDTNTMQKYTKAIGHLAMIDSPIGAKFTLQFLVAVLTFAAFVVLVVNAVRQRAGSGAIGHHSSANSFPGRSLRT